MLTLVALVAYPGYGIIFHELSSDAVFAAAFAGWSLLVVRTLPSPSPRGFALVGAGVGILALVRPGNQVLLLLAVLPLLLFAVLVYTDAPRWTVFAILAFELAVGGLDNLLSHHKVATLALAWGGRVLGVSLLLGGALTFPTLATPFAILATAISVSGVSAEFYRGRSYYMGALS